MKKILLSTLALALAVGLAQAAPKARPGAAQAGKAYVEKMLQVPEVKSAQEKVWDARVKLYEARHDRTLAGINYHKAEVEKNNPPNKDEWLKKLDKAKADADKALELQKQLVDAEKAQDWAKVKSINQELRQLKMQNRAAMRGAMGKRMKGAKGAAAPAMEGPMEGSMWGDEGNE